MAATGDQSQPVTGRRRDGYVVPAVCASLLGLRKIYDFQTKMSEVSNDDHPVAKAFSVSVQIGFGLYLLVAAGFAVAAVSWMFANPQPSQGK